MKTNPPLTFIASFMGGVLLFGVYLTCVSIAWAFYPSAFSPWANMISRLGNPAYNPAGAVFFNVGNILTGVCMVPFFLGFRIWRSEQKRQALLVTLVQVVGFIDALAVILVGVMAEGISPIHGYFGGFYFLTNSCVLTLAYFALRNHPLFLRSVAKFYLVVIILYYMNAIALGLVPLVEWLAVFLGLVLDLTLLYNAVRVFHRSSK